MTVDYSIAGNQAMSVMFSYSCVRHANIHLGPESSSVWSSNLIKPSLKTTCSRTASGLAPAASRQAVELQFIPRNSNSEYIHKSQVCQLFFGRHSEKRISKDHCYVWFADRTLYFLTDRIKWMGKRILIEAIGYTKVSNYCQKGIIILFQTVSDPVVWPTVDD